MLRAAGLQGRVLEREHAANPHRGPTGAFQHQAAQLRGQTAGGWADTRQGKTESLQAA